mgnify:CR=1 FL=1
MFSESVTGSVLEYRPGNGHAPRLRLAAFNRGPDHRCRNQNRPGFHEAGGSNGVVAVIYLRLDPEVLAVLRATGAGWQTRIDAILLEPFAL